MATKKKAPAEGNSPLDKLLDKHESLKKLGDYDLSVRKVPTGIWTLDDTLAGGIPMGKVIEIHGGGGSGKTSLACLISAAFQREFPDKSVVYIDAESALDEFLAIEMYGLDPERTLLSRPDIDNTAEILMDQLVDAAMNPGVSLVILDSVAGLVTDAEMKKKAGDLTVAATASLMARTVKKLCSRQDPNAAPVIFLNQIRHAIGNSGITTPGGSSMEFYPSLRLRLRRGDPVKDGEEEIGFSCRCQVMKARYSRNRLVTGWSVIYGPEGISTLRSIVTVAMAQKLIVQNSSWFSIAGQDGKKWQGMEKMLDAIREDPELQQFIIDNLKQEYIVGD